MTGVFSDKTPEKCMHYARFMKHLSRHQADAVFWSLFSFMVVLLVTASQMYTKASKTLKNLENDDLEKSDAKRSLLKQTRHKCLTISLLCFFFALACVIFEAFAAFSIQFCDGEDLMMLYWGFWTLVQVGSLIAILGISLNQWYTIQNREQPPWNVALGTPVLVIAAFAHAWNILAIGAWKRYVKKEGDISNSPNVGGMRAMSQVSTIGHPSARHVGFSLQNEPLFAVPANEPGLPLLGATPSISGGMQSGRRLPLTTNSSVETIEETNTSPVRSIRFADMPKRRGSF